ncbi:MAG TPA: hypothetical protein VK249_10285 [Anaerolineales bacterium]|nr:hypothetical protein [Anaerolineales bacterium]
MDIAFRHEGGALTTQRSMDHPGRLSPQARNFLTAVDYEYLYD